METKRRLVLMIDGDNAQAALLPQILDAVSQHGKITIRRVYGDWSKPHMNSWKEASHTYALRPEQQFSYTKGKNATDIALTIGAMDFLHRHKEEIDGFCIISSDSDYTPLVNRIHENNLFVIGVGRNDTAEAFCSACDVFIYIEDLEPVEKAEFKVETAKPEAPKEKPMETVIQTTVNVNHLRAVFRNALDSAAKDSEGWVELGALGNSLKETEPGFQARLYGHRLLSKMVEAYPKFLEVDKRKNKNGNDITYVRFKQKSTAIK